MRFCLLDRQRMMISIVACGARHYSAKDRYQLYLRTTGALRGALVYMTQGLVRWVAGRNEVAG